MKNYIKQRYYWVIILLISLEMTVMGGLVNSINVAMIPICEDLGVSRASYAILEIPYRISGAVSTMFSIVLYRKLGYKKTSVITLCIVALSYVLMSVSRNLLAMGFCRALLGIGYGMALTTGAVWVVKLWFVRHQGMLVGLVTMFTGLGGSIMTIIITSWIQHFGWRTTSLLTAGLVELIVLLYLLLLEDRPDGMGLKPLGYGVIQTGHKKLDADVVWAGPNLQQWTRKPLLYVMIAFTLVSSVLVCISFPVLVPHFQDQGFTPQEAAVYQSTYMLVLAAAKLLCGTTSDKLGAKAVGAVCIVCGAAGHGILSMTADPILCYLGVSLVAIGICMTTVIPPLLVPVMFGYFSADTITSILLAVISVSSIFSSLIANLGYDAFGTYCYTFGVSAVINLALLTVYGLMFVMAKKERKQFELQDKHAI